MTNTLYGVVTRKTTSADVRIERIYNYSAAELWSALTDPRRLAGWLGDLSGDLRVGGTYRAELGTEVGTSTGRILICEPESRLLASWQFVGGQETELEALLEDAGPGKTRLTLENRGIAMADAPAGYSAGWHVFFDRLGEMLDTGSAVSFLDAYSAAYCVYDDQLNALGVLDAGLDDDPSGGQHGSVRFERTYEAPPEDVWSALTESNRLARWLGTVTGDLRTGGRYRLDFGDGDEAAGRVVACEKPSRLEVTWEFPGEGTTRLEATLTAMDDGTLVTLSHTRLRRADLSQYGAGWHTFLDHLDVVLAGREPSGWQTRYEELHPRYLAQIPEPH
ncbi:SRPBCC family protein [Spelaeicoccus albus]|uniref:Uncharacterized protein YndB with AHSA1/START domain n=1 Tax=Spelaeicoccus albus TaxID=1280376 RepID=A0A7Z0AAB7_9MICO|nr:SRPBCC family protein [Spelaeicoccus albus]NYI67342.1 uncharacterized protein YndB with AHSA1/START domain [Spelaeicoccus albus]